MSYKSQVQTIIDEYPFNITQKIKKDKELAAYIETNHPARSLGESIFIFMYGDNKRYAKCGYELKF